jgi:hypothetical protein
MPHRQPDQLVAEDVPRAAERLADRRTRRWTSTGCPATGAPAIRRSYELRTRPEATPHAGHGASSASARTRRQTALLA